MRRKSSNSESGVILLIVIILMLALTITGIAFLNAGVMEYRLAKREVHKNQAFYLAEGGVEHTRVVLGEHWDDSQDYSPVIPTIELEGTYIADIYNTDTEGDLLDPDNDSKRRIRSTGAVKEVSQIVQVIVRQAPIGAKITSALESGGSVELKSAAAAINDGDVVAAGEITDKHDCIDDIYEKPYIDKFGPNPDDYFYEVFNASKEEMKEKAQESPNIYYGEAVKNEPVNNITWIEGGGTQSEFTRTDWDGEGILVVNGSLKITGGSFYGIIWVTGSIDIPSGNPVIRGVVFVEGDTIVDITGNLDLTYDPEAIDQAVDKVATLPWIEFWEQLQ